MTKSKSPLSRGKSSRRPVKSASQASPRRRLTKSQMRVAIAEDVLKVLAYGDRSKYVIRRLVYCDTDHDLLPAPTSDKDLRDVLSELGKCRVCARGALFLSAVKLFDSQPLKDLPVYAWNESLVDLDSASKERSYNDFGDQIEVIERAFEGWQLGADPEEGYSGRAWVDEYPDATHRLRAILRNIIANRGEFDITRVKGWRTTERGELRAGR